MKIRLKIKDNSQYVPFQSNKVNNWAHIQLLLYKLLFGQLFIWIQIQVLVHFRIVPLHHQALAQTISVQLRRIVGNIKWQSQVLGQLVYPASCQTITAVNMLCHVKLMESPITQTHLLSILHGLDNVTMITLGEHIWI